MVDRQPASCREHVIDTMIDLARATQKQRVIVAGSDNLEIYLGLQRRGFERTATPATCRIPCGQHDVGLIAGWHSMPMLEKTISQLVYFLHSAAILVVSTEAHDSARARDIQLLLERWGFRVEAGTCCGDGLVLAARRRERLAAAA